MDGYLKIKTKIDNKDVDKQIKQLEDKIKKMQTDISQGEKEQESLQMQINQYEELANEAEEYRQTLKRLEKDRANMVKSDPNLVVSNTPEYTNLMTQIDSMKQKYASATKELDKQAPKIDKVYSKLEQVKAKQTENNAKIVQYRQEIEQVNMQNMQKGVDNVGKSITKQIKKIGKLGMAVIGIRSAWFAVRGAINAVTQYNDQVAADFEYMRYAVAQLLLPAVQQLVKILFTVLSYVNAITSAWFGINLFSNASAKSFQKMKAGASGTAKAVKEIQKSLQGFDEMNVMSDNSSSGSGTSAGGVAPSMDLTGMQGEVPAWLQWIIDNKDLIISTLAGIAGGLAALKLSDFLQTLGLISGKITGIKALGIGVAIAGIVLSILQLIKYIKDPSWDNFGKLITAIRCSGIRFRYGNIWITWHHSWSSYDNCRIGCK